MSSYIPNGINLVCQNTELKVECLGFTDDIVFFIKNLKIAIKSNSANIVWENGIYEHKS